jgi:hypothetical protein
MNRATTKGFKRQTQTLRCCGHLYRRWRFFDPTRERQPKFHGIKKCQSCGSHLRWPANYEEPDRKKINRERMRDRAVNFLLQGLTTNGKVRARHPNFKPESNQRRHIADSERLRRNHIRARVLKHARVRIQKFISQGLNSRGQKRRYQLGQKSRFTMAWQSFRQTLTT